MRRKGKDKSRGKKGPDKSAFYATLLLAIVPAVLFFVFVCPHLVSYFGAIVIVIPVHVTIGCVVVLCIASYMDPGVIPPGSKDSINLYIKNYNNENNNTPDDVISAPSLSTLIPPTNYYHNKNPQKDNKITDITPKVQLAINGTPVTVRWCQTCNVLRPPRASHCSDCDRCVEHFDHHCPWVGNCIGKRNYKFFMLFIYSCTFLTLYVFGFSVLRLVWLVMDDKNIFEAVLLSPVSMILVIYAFFLFWSVGILSGYHSWLVGNAVTTNEEMKNLYEEKSPYNLGFFQNFAHVCFAPWWPSYAKTMQTFGRPRKLTNSEISGDENEENDDESTGVRSRKSTPKSRSETAQLLSV